LIKFNSSGVRQWGTYYGGAGDDFIRCSAIDVLGNVYFSGQTSSTSNIAFGGYQNVFGGGTEAFLIKLNSSGVLQWGTYYGSITADISIGCATDLSANIYLAGYSQSTSGIVSGGHQNTHGGGSWDGFLVKFCDNPAQPSSIIGNTITCVGNPQLYSVTNNTAATSYSWSFSGSWSGSSTSNSIVAAINNNGVLSVIAQNTCGASLSKTLSIATKTLPILSVNSASICSGESFTIIPSGAVIYTYSGGNSVVSPSVSSSYSINGTNSLGCIGLSPVISTITVFATPTISVNSGSICNGQSFTIVPAGANTYTYSGGSNIINPSTNMTYSVTGTSTAGCISTLSAVSNITVFTIPLISINSGSICLGQSFTLNPSGANTYTITGGSNIVSPATNTSYSVSGTSSAGCVSTLAAISNLTVNSLPIILIDGTQLSICAGESIILNVSGAATYTWNNGSNGTNVIIQPIITTTYSIIGANTSGCQNTASVTQNVDACTGVTKFGENKNVWTVYPNPSNGMFIIEAPHTLNFAILDALGQVILRQTILQGSNNIDLTAYANGLYFLRCEYALRILKLVKQ